MVGKDNVTVMDTFLGEVNKEWNYEWDLELGRNFSNR
jgi:hypothetical protein